MEWVRILRAPRSALWRATDNGLLRSADLNRIVCCCKGLQGGAWRYCRVKPVGALNAVEKHGVDQPCVEGGGRGRHPPEQHQAGPLNSAAWPQLIRLHRQCKTKGMNREAKHAHAS